MPTREPYSHNRNSIATDKQPAEILDKHYAQHQQSPEPTVRRIIHKQHTLILDKGTEVLIISDATAKAIKTTKTLDPQAPIIYHTLFILNT